MSDHALTEPAIAAIARLVEAASDNLALEFHFAPDNDAYQHDAINLIAVPKMGGGYEWTVPEKLLDQFRARPFETTGTAPVTSIDSFCALVDRHKVPNSAVFVDTNWLAPKLTAVIDYHADALLDDPASRRKTARFGKHRIVYAFPITPAFAAWSKADGKEFAQAEFAAFIEDRIVDIADAKPVDEGEFELLGKLGANAADATKMLELSRGLEIRENVKVKNASRISSGEVEMTFETSHVDAKGEKLIVPQAFFIGLVLFSGSEPQRLLVRLYYRRDNGVILWRYRLYRLDMIVDKIIAEARDKVFEATELPIYDGAPEA
ncbi:MAG: DUF2303 family protein [Ancalomicrobiaceae bacterium]|nr:DUF2303 family protein [Ancalomicrobiaceae bacterium]